MKSLGSVSDRAFARDSVAHAPVADSSVGLTAGCDTSLPSRCNGWASLMRECRVLLIASPHSCDDAANQPGGFPMRYLPRVTRRRFLGLLGGAAALGSTPGASSRTGSRSSTATCRSPACPTHLVGKTLVQLSDLHVGPRVDSAFLERSLRLVNDLGPTSSCITGDFMTCNGGEQIDEVARVMESLAVPPMGCFAVLGNHDYGTAGGDPRTSRRPARLPPGGPRHRDAAQRLATDGRPPRHRPRRPVEAAVRHRARGGGPRLADAVGRPVPQPRRGRPRRSGGLSRLDPVRPHARRAVQAALPPAAGHARSRTSATPPGRSTWATGGTSTSTARWATSGTCGSTSGRRSRCSG